VKKDKIVKGAIVNESVQNKLEQNDTGENICNDQFNFGIPDSQTFRFYG